METMRYSETKKSAKGPIIGLILFCIFGGVVIYFGLSAERTDEIAKNNKAIEETQSLVDVDKARETADENALIEYKVEDKKVSDNANSKMKADMTFPQISISGEMLESINKQILDKYTETFVGLKSQTTSTANKFTYLVTYNVYDNMVGSQKILSLTVHQRIVDDAIKKNTMEKIETYNIDLATKEIVKLNNVALSMLGKDYKSIMTNAVKDYVVSKNMIKENEYTYVLTGLENFYIKEGNIHIVFNEKELVDAKYGVIDITISK